MSNAVPSTAVALTDALGELDGLLQRQALALQGGRAEEVEALTGRIQQLLDGLDLTGADSARDPGLRARLEALFATARLHHQALQEARAKIAARRGALARCGVEWYGDRPPVVRTDAHFNLSI